MKIKEMENKVKLKIKRKNKVETNEILINEKKLKDTIMLIIPWLLSLLCV